jgi:hypothetical protein
MSKRAFNKIMQGLAEARAYLDGTADKSRYRVHTKQEIFKRKVRTASRAKNQPAKGSR